MTVTRRGVLIGSLVGGGLAVGYLLRPQTWPLPMPPGKDETAFDAWIRIAKDGMVTVAAPQLEMGQGVATLIAQVVAVELGADWRQVAIEPAPVSPYYANGVLAARWAELWMPLAPGLAETPGNAIAHRWAEGEAFMATAEGLSLSAYEPPARNAAATARALLCMAAAHRWGIEWEQCEARDGFVTSGKRKLAFGVLAQDAVRFDPPSPPPLRLAPAREVAADALPGAPLRFPRIDLPAKVDGSLLFAADVRLPGMVFAALRHGPVGDSTLGRFDEAAAKEVPGLLRVVKHKRWLAAVATDSWAAERALAAMAPRFVARGRADSTRIEAALDQALAKGEPVRLFEKGEPGVQFASRATLTQRYDVGPAIHAGLETASATARVGPDRAEVWVASQSPGHARRSVARALDMAERDVVIYTVPAGGSFDRRLEHSHAVQAALIARAIGKPVQLTWTRWQEALAGLPRAPAAALMSARMGAGGSLTGWKARLAVPATTREFGRRLLGGQTPREAMRASAGESDRLALAGSIPVYAIPTVAIDHISTAINLPTGRLRGNAHGYTAFFTESFIDELAHKAGREPLSWRIAMLGHDLRLVQCLQTCASLARWDGGIAASGQGLACHVMGDAGAQGRIAVIATARRSEAGVRVDRLTAVADIGRTVNRDIARQQIEGGLVFGMGIALGASTGYAEGLPTTSRLSAMALPTLADCPEIEVEIINSESPPFDPGELGVAAVAPAIANALFSATGIRFRRLPLIGEDL